MKNTNRRTAAFTLRIMLLLAAVSWLAQSTSAQDFDKSNIQLRGEFNNARIRFEKEGQGHVAFMGGSITEMNGYRPMVCDILTKRFPKTKFTFTAAGISSTCSTTGAMRLRNDVLSKGPVDLFFVEFAVNDDQDAGHAKRECLRGMEGIIRQCLKHNPKMDIVMTYFVNPGMLSLLQNEKTPTSMAAHQQVAEHYQVSVIHLAQEVAREITAGSLTWAKFGGTHPKPPGNRICANMIDNLMSQAWSKPIGKTDQPSAHSLPETIDGGSYSNGHFVASDAAVSKSGWELKQPIWKSIPGGFRGRFGNQKLHCAEQSGSEIEIKFSGRGLGAYVLAGPDAGTLEVSVDGGKFVSTDLFHRYSRGLHYPRTVMFVSDLKEGDHSAVVRVSESHNKQSKGHAARVLHFVAN